MRLSTLRGVVLVTCAVGIAGMIVTTLSTDNNNGWVITFGLATAAAMVALIVATATHRPPVTGAAEELATRIEARVGELAGHGAPEGELRGLVGDAVRFGRERSGR
jgi:hypothetical protein